MGGERVGGDRRRRGRRGCAAGTGGALGAGVSDAGGVVAGPGAGGAIGAAGMVGAGGAGGAGGGLGNGGAPGAGGALDAVGTGGAVGAGGAPGPGGAPGAGGNGSGGGAGTGAGGGNVGTGGRSGTGGAPGTGGVPGTGGARGTGGAGGAGDTAQYNFESSAQSWRSSNGSWSAVGRTTAAHFAGTAALGGTIRMYDPTEEAEESTFELSISRPTLAPMAGDTVTFHVFLPASAAGVVAGVQPFVMDGAAPAQLFATQVPAGSLAFGAWSTITLVLPGDVVSPLLTLGVRSP